MRKSYCIFTTRSIQEGVKDKCTKIIRSLSICYTVELSSIVQPILGDRSPNVLNHGTTKWLVLRTFDNERKLIKWYLADGSAWTRCGELTVLPRPLAGFEGPLRSKGGDGRQKQGIKKRGREGEEVEKGGEQEGTGGKEERERKRGEGRGWLPIFYTLVSPLILGQNVAFFVSKSYNYFLKVQTQKCHLTSFSVFWVLTCTVTMRWSL